MQKPCQLVYVDVGANIGDSLIHFAQQHVNEHGLQQQLRKARSSWTPASTCVYAFEPNPRHSATLAAVQRKLSAEFSSLRIFTETAVVGTDEKHIRFSAPNLKKDKNSVGGQVGADGTLVRAVNLAEWLLSTSADHPGLPIVVRMDIEAQEYAVLADLALSGAPRKLRRKYNAELYLAIEWHRNLKKSALKDQLPAIEHLDQYTWECAATRSAAVAAAATPPPRLPPQAARSAPTHLVSSAVQVQPCSHDPSGERDDARASRRRLNTKSPLRPALPSLC
jgi:FkbM family methyltransferase